MAAVTAISAEGRVRSMSDLLKRIANYFANEYNGDDKTAPKMELSVDELRYIASINVERCRAEAELREMKNKRYSRTNADRIRSMSDEELADIILCPYDTEGNPIEIMLQKLVSPDNCKKCMIEWLQSEEEE